MKIYKLSLTLYCLLRIKVHELTKISILKIEGIIEKISYERRDYESVEEKSLSQDMSRKITKKKFIH